MTQVDHRVRTHACVCECVCERVCECVCMCWFARACTCVCACVPTTAGDDSVIQDRTDIQTQTAAVTPWQQA